MSDLGGRFKFLKKFSSKVDKLFLGDMIESNKLDSKKVSRNSQYSAQDNEFLQNEDSFYKFNRNSNESYNNSDKYYNNFNDDNKLNNSYFDDKYSEYIYNEEFNRNPNFKNDLKYSDDFDNEYDFYFKENSPINQRSQVNSWENGNNSFNQNYDLDKNKSNSKNSSFNLKDLKNKLLNSDEHSKKNFGLIAISLIILVLGASIFYFGLYQPFQNELNTEKTAKLNELNTLYKGPLALNSHVFSLENQIQDSYDINEIKSINILRSATDDWRKYHISKINAFEDQYGRIMMSYSDNNSKKVLMPVDDASLFINENDAKILSNIEFGKVDTVIVPIYITRLQATGGLISVGSIVDIYSLSSNTTDYSLNSESEDSTENSENISSEESSNLEDIDSKDSENLNNSNEENNNGFASNINASQNSKTIAEDPDVSGATVLAILRSKDGGIIDSTFSKSTNLIKGNNTYPTEDSSSFSTDAEELLKSSIFNGHDNGALSSYLDSYGIKLSNYERLSNIGELDTDYLVLLEIPRSDVDFVINNMENLILTIPTEYAPNWAINELNETYYDELDKNERFFK